MKPVVRQMKGPGMNYGLKKPRKKPAAPKDTPPARVKELAGPENYSYLPPEGKDGKPRSPKAPKSAGKRRIKPPFAL